MEDTKDVNEEKDTPSESSTEETNSENVTEDEKMSESKTVPKERLDEVLTKYNALKEKVGTLSAKEETKKEVVKSDDGWKQWMEFVVENKDLDKEQLSTAKRLYEAGTPLDKVLEDPLYEAFSEKHEKTKVERDASPSTSRSPKVAPEKPQSEMTEAEHRAYYKKLIGK